MADRHTPDAVEPAAAELAREDDEAVLTTPEDVASAGRSCMAIVVLGAIIVLVVLLWLIYRAFGGA